MPPLSGGPLLAPSITIKLRAQPHGSHPMPDQELFASSPLSDNTRQQLEDVRRALLRVHKALLEDARIRYEREQGRIEGSGALLRLVLNDPWFDWLHPLSGLVVQIDELLAAEDAKASDGDALLAQARTLLRPDATGDGFQRRYHRAIQDAPDVLIAHVAAGRVLGA